jgi:hypothetical protein
MIDSAANALRVAPYNKQFQRTVIRRHARCRRAEYCRAYGAPAVRFEARSTRTLGGA